MRFESNTVQYVGSANPSYSEELMSRGTFPSFSLQFPAGFCTYLIRRGYGAECGIARREIDECEQEEFRGIGGGLFWELDEGFQMARPLLEMVDGFR